MGDMGAGSSADGSGSQSAAVFIGAPSEGRSAFDVSALTGALPSEVFVGPEHPDDEAPADVFVPGVIFFSVATIIVFWLCLYYV